MLPVAIISIDDENIVNYDKKAIANQDVGTTNVVSIKEDVCELRSVIKRGTYKGGGT